MKESERILRVLSARHVRVPLLALVALAAVARADTLLDPTRPATARDVPDTHGDVLRVEAVFMSGEHRVAIVNGVLVRAGERIGPAVVAEVLADGVRYTLDGAVHTVRLPRSGMTVRSDAGAEHGS